MLIKNSRKFGYAILPILLGLGLIVGFAFSFSVHALSSTLVAESSGTENLLQNPGFESGKSFWDEVGTVVLSSDAYSGTQAIRMGVDQSGVQQSPSVEPRHAYVFSGYAKVDASETAWAGFGVDFYDANGNHLDGWMTQIVTTTYQPFIGFYVAPDGAAYAEVWVGKGDGNAYFYADELVFREEPNMLQNPGFESGFEHWYTWYEDEMSLSSDANNGTHALAIGSGMNAVWQYVHGMREESYTLRGWAKVDAGEAAAIGIDFYDSDWAFLERGIITVTNTIYQPFTLTYNAPVGTVYAETFAWKDAGSGFLYVDDLSLSLSEMTSVAADFTATPLNGMLPLAVTFSNNSVDADSYLWEFGDGITSTVTTPTHVYEQAGVYTVTLTATGPGGTDVFSRVDYITVTDVVSSEFDCGWWNESFFYRRPLTLTTTIPIVGDNVSINTVSAILENTDVLIDAGKLQADGEDMRIVYLDEAGCHEVPTLLSPIISPTLTITFPLQTELVQNDNDGYWLYYGNKVAEQEPKMELPQLTGSDVISSVTGTVVVTPTVDFLSDARLVWTTDTIVFTSYVTPTADTLIWDFGDDITTTTSLTQTSHVYNATGSYTVTLTAVMPDGLEVAHGYAGFITVLSARDEDVTIDVGMEETPVITATLYPGVGEQTVTSAAGDLQVIFPDGVITQTLVVKHTPFKAEVEQNAVVLNRFDITAVTDATGASITQFSDSVLLGFDYSLLNLTSEEAETLLFFYWNEDDQEWEPIPTTVNPALQTVFGKTTHFSHFALATNYGFSVPALRRLPSVSSTGVDLLTGSSTYVYPLEVPPGTNGMQPNLSLVYNSGAADTLLDQQAGLVGHGFELSGLGWIQLDPDSGYYYLNLNGVSERLVPAPVSTNAAIYYTEHNHYWRIEKLDNGENGIGTGKYWVVTTQDGTRYEFGNTPDSVSISPYMGDVEAIYRFELNEIQDTYNNTISVEYKKFTETLYIPSNSEPTTYTAISVNTAPWPIRIKYTENDGLTILREVVFNYGQPDQNVTNEVGLRADYNFHLINYGVGPGSEISYPDAVTDIEMYLGGTRIRTYDLSYKYYTPKGEQESSFGPDKYHLMLTGVQEHGTGGQGLPTTTLTYAETGHLRSIVNGYGGSVTFGYEKIESGIRSLDYSGVAWPTRTIDPDTDRWRVSTRTIASHGATPMTFAYDYIGAGFDDTFVGHQQVKVTDPEGSATKAYFSLGSSYYTTFDAWYYSKKVPWGKPYRIEVLQDGSKLLSKTEFEYDAADNLECSKTLYSERLVTCYDYDEYGNITRIDENGERVTKIGYLSSPSGRYLVNLPDYVRIYNSAGTAKVGETNYDYDFYANGYTVAGVTVTQEDVSDWGGPSQVTYSHFDQYGNVDETWNRDNEHKTSIEYDDTYRTFPDTITYADGSSETYAYDAGFGLMTGMTNASNFTISNTYDELGRLKTQNGVNGPITYHYNDVDKESVEGLTVNVDAFGKTNYLVQSYNGLGQLLKEVQLNQLETTYAYDSQGRVVMSTLPHDVGSSDIVELASEYDALGRPVRVETRDGETTYTYQTLLTVFVEDALSRTTTYELDGLGRVVEVIEPGGLSTTYDYVDDTPNASLKITDADNHKTFIYYDSLGRKVRLNDPDMGIWYYTYDSYGNLHTQTDARGVATILTYDSIGRPISKTYAAPEIIEVVEAASVSYEYPSPMQTIMTDGSGNTVLNYYPSGLLGSEVKTIGNDSYTTSYTYDDYGRLQTMTYPDGEVVTYGYNDLNQVNSLAGYNTYLADQTTYDSLGQPDNWALGNGIVQDFDYDPKTFRPKSAETLGSDLQDLTFRFNAVGNLEYWRDVDTGDWLDPKYDSLHRLYEVNSNVDDYKQDYDYDDVGNLTNRDGLVLTYNGRPHLPNTDSLGTNYLYDANGNLTSRTLNNGAVISYTYDAANLLVNVISETVNISGTVTGSTMTTFEYDGNGERVTKLGNGAQWTYLGSHMEGIFDSIDNGTNLSNSATDSTYPSLALSANEIPYVVWGEDGEVFFYDLNWAEPISITYNLAGTHENPTIAVDTNGTIHVAWLGDGKILYSDSIDGGINWSQPYSVSNYNYNHSTSGWPKNIVVDSNQNVHIFWSQDQYSDGNYYPDLIHRYRFADGTWSSEITVLNTFCGGCGVHAKAGLNGEVHSFFEDRYSMWRNGEWGEEIILPDHRDSVVDGLNTIHIVGINRNVGGVNNNDEIYYQYKEENATDWSAVELVHASTNGVKSVQLDVTPNGELHLIFVGNNKEIYHQYKEENATDWSAVELVHTLTNYWGSSVDLEIDQNSDLHLILFDRAAGVMYANHTVDGWSAPQVLVPIDADLLKNDELVVSSSGKIHLTFNTEVAHVGGNYHDVFYYGEPVPKTSVKRYYAGGVQVATRVDDTLVYNLHDPSGMSLVMADVDGNEVGRMLYDGYGSVLTSTVPITLTGAAADVPDATTGLVYQGGGRWYDPAIGRPLQPNAAGGPPTLPQALNRYAATPVGQPGVYQAAETNSAMTSFAIASGSNAVSAGSGMALSSYANYVVGDLLIHTQARTLADAGYESVFRRVMAPRGGRAYYLSTLVEQIDDGTFRAVDSGLIIDLVPLETKGLKYPTGKAFDALDDTIGKQFLRTTAGELAAGTAINIALSIPELLAPWDNPYLNNGQRGVQNLVTLGGAAASAGAAFWVGNTAWFASMNTIPQFAVLTGTGLVVYGAWEYAVKPGVSWIAVNLFKRVDPYQINRNLQPLGGTQ